MQVTLLTVAVVGPIHPDRPRVLTVAERQVPKTKESSDPNGVKTTRIKGVYIP